MRIKPVRSFDVPEENKIELWVAHQSGNYFIELVSVAESFNWLSIKEAEEYYQALGKAIELAKTRMVNDDFGGII